MKNLRAITMILATCILAGCAASPPAIQQVRQPAPPADPLVAGFQRLADQVVAGLQSEQATQIAVLQFQNLDGSVSEFGGFIAEEMITRLYQTGTFRVVEREMLNRVMEEHELATSGLVDESTAKELGRLLGVDAIATGSVTDLGMDVRINSRLIATETGSVFSAAAASVPKDSRVTKLMDRILIPRDGEKVVIIDDSSSEDKTVVLYASGTFFYEDFSGVDEGLVPASWIGGEHIQVGPDPAHEGRNYLFPFEKGPYRFTIPDIKFPEDWKLTVNFRLDRRGGAAVQTWQIGDLSIKMRNTGVTIKDTKKKRNFAIGQPARMEIIKEGPVFKLYFDSQKLSVVRIDGFEAPMGITVTDGSGFAVYSIKGEAL
jgi:TolB-like protein